MNTHDVTASGIQKRAYESPRLVVEGNIRDLTLGNKNGNQLDASFPIHTPKKNLTFS